MFDSYVRRARFYPAAIAAASAFALAVALVPWNHVGLPHAIAGGTLAILMAVMSDVARRRGRAIEPALIGRMGGSPSTTMMRYRDATFDRATKDRIHSFVGSKIGADAPTPEDEQANPAAADGFYVRCGNWLREHTRDTKKFNILFEENVTYGFRRNLLGLKWAALALDTIIVLFCLTSLSPHLPLAAALPIQKLQLVVLVALFHAAYFFLLVNESGVVDAARVYGRQLLLSTETFAADAP